jgi:hypothetical protein
MRIALFIIFFFYSSFISFAEVIYLKNGSKIEGRILEKEDDHVTVDYQGVKITYAIAEIDCITKEEKLKSPELNGEEYLKKFSQLAAEARSLCEIRLVIDGKEINFAPKADKLVWKELINYYEGKKATLQDLRRQLLRLVPPPEFSKMHETLKKSFVYAIAGYKKAIIALEKDDITIMSREGAVLLSKAADLTLNVVYSLKKEMEKSHAGKIMGNKISEEN